MARDARFRAGAQNFFARHGSDLAARPPPRRGFALYVMDDYVLDARVEHVRNFVHILTAVKLSRKQHARVSVGERGLTIVSLDDSKSLQAQANFRAEVFRAYDVNLAAASHHHHAGTRRAGVSSHAATFALALGPLIDVLSAFAPLDGEAELSLRWPDRDGRLLLSAHHAERGAPDRPLRGCTHAAVSPETVTAVTGDDDDIVFRGERNAFTLPTTTLREIVDDLDWPAAPVALEMRAHPTAHLAFASEGKDTGGLRIDVDATGAGSRLSEFHCGEPGRWTYRHRFLKAAASVPTQLWRRRRRRGRGRRADDDARRGRGGRHAQGRAPRAHRQGGRRDGRGGFGGGGGAGATGASARVSAQAGTGPTQQTGGTQRGTATMVPVTFVAYPEAEEEEEGDGSEDGGG